MHPENALRPIFVTLSGIITLVRPVHPENAQHSTSGQTVRQSKSTDKMSNKTTYNIRIDSRIKKEADALYKSMGMSLSSAVNLFLTQSVIQRRFPTDEVIAELLGEPPTEDEYNSFET